eukprot:TRINITY_DN4792_c0_g1_i1.p1 TRINITY_DN4792_c0_g1~~TRINITY_DN4792_c0_g1_i1.p1  ORF type:complete len:175 (-),score=31.92 TRINITY_DN4792_c0_g1_i1:170-694(-)
MSAENNDGIKELQSMQKMLDDLESKISFIEQRKREIRSASNSSSSTYAEATPSMNGVENAAGASIQHETPAQQENITIILKNGQTTPGQEIFVIGNLKELGEWKPNAALKLKTDQNSYPTWNTVVALRLGEEIKFKFFKMANNDINSIQWDSHPGDYTRVFSKDNETFEATWTN